METTFDSIIESYNQKNEFVTKIWVWIAIISLFGAIIITQPQKDNAPCNTQNIQTLDAINFPLIDINIPRSLFTVVFVLILSAMVIRWVDAFQRSYKFRQNVIEPLIKEENITVNDIPINSRYLLDGIVYSTTTSVWGLIPDFKEKNRKLLVRILRKSIYLILKTVVMLVHFILPAVIIVFAAFFKLNPDTVLILKIITKSIAIISVTAIIYTMIMEICYIIIAWKNQLNLR